MRYNFLNTSISNLYAKPSSKAEVSSQIIYGEKFKILSKKKSWVKIKTSYDNYVGFIKNNNFKKKFKPTKKVYKLKARIYKKVKKKFLLTNQFLYFASGISVISKNKTFIQYFLLLLFCIQRHTTIRSNFYYLFWFSPARIC